MGATESSLSIAERVINILVREGELEPQEVTLESDLRDDLGLDSVDTVHILFGLEDEFNVEIPQEDIDGVEKVTDIVEYLTKKVNELGPQTQQA